MSKEEDSDGPSTMTVFAADIQRMITAAANEAAVNVSKEARLTREDVGEILERGIEHFCDRMGLPTNKEGIEEWRKDLTAMRATRETRDALLDHGLKAVITVLAGGILTAIWLAIRGVR
jgi:hypothetical protein